MRVCTGRWDFDVMVGLLSWVSICKMEKEVWY
jgi:hypothetical protein